MADEWHSRAKALICPTCHEWILVGKTQNGNMGAASVMVVTAQNVMSHLATGRKMYAVMPGGYLMRLSGCHGQPLDAWRPEHPCGVPEVPERPTAAPMVDPCPFPPPAQPGLGCQRATRSITGCHNCRQDGAVPPFSPGPASGDPEAPRGPQRAAAETSRGNVAFEQDGAGHVLMAELGAIPIERVRRGRVVWRDSKYQQGYW